jgi:DNA-binding protein YbaB
MSWQDTPPVGSDPDMLARHEQAIARLASYRRFVAGVTGALAQLRAAQHTGHDDTGTVHAQIDGDGTVAAITLDVGATRLDSRALAAAVLVALRQAEQHRTDALLELASQVTSPTDPPADTPALNGTRRDG